MALSPDLVIAYRTTSYGFLGALSGFHPLVVASQGETDVWPVDSWSAGLKRWMARTCLRHADLIHAWGDHMAEEHVALGATGDRILVRPRGVDLERFVPAAAGNPGDALRLVVTRSLFPEYRHDVILDAVAAVAGRGIPVSVDIAGDGVTRSALARQVRQLGLDGQVRFHGRVTHQRLPELLRRCNVYVSTPITEGVSASLLEAMACGCYPIVTDLVANRYWITHRVNGMLVPVGNAPALEHALVDLWRQRALIAEVATRNRALVAEKASLRDNIACFVQHYERLVGAARRARDRAAA
jgi:glycosyltransferase involved in cell wall biosynthesis